MASTKKKVSRKIREIQHSPVAKRKLVRRVTALPTDKISAAPVEKTAAVAEKSDGTAQRSVRTGQHKEPTYEQIQLRAYFIGERRKFLRIQGNDMSDWVQAELELRAEQSSK